MSDSIVSIIQVLIVGILPFIGAILGFLFSYWIEKSKTKALVKEYPTKIVYDKQTEFFDQLPPLFDNMDGYITSIKAYLNEGKVTDYQKDLEKSKPNTESIDKLIKLIHEYYFYLPAELYHELGTLINLCFKVREIPDIKFAKEANDKLFHLKNKIRKYIGTEKISEDLLKAFMREKNI